MFFTREKKLRQEAEARARGEPVDQLRPEAPDGFRIQVLYALLDADGTGYVRRGIMPVIHSALVREYGVSSLADANDSVNDLERFIRVKSTTHQLMDVINVAGAAIAATERRPRRDRRRVVRPGYPCTGRGH